MKRLTGFGSRLLSFCLCLAMLLTGQAPRAAAESAGAAAQGPVPFGIHVADPSTMDSYLTEMLDETNGSRYAGRVWTDKTVFAYGAARDKGGLENNLLTLDEDTDGYDGSLGFDADFLDVYSALASSQAVNDNLSAPFDLVLVVDMSGSMAQSTKYAVNVDDRNGYRETMTERIQNSRIQQLLDAVNETIDVLMAQNPENRVSVCVYGANAAVLMPLAHYQRIDGQPYLTIGGMETLYDRDDYDTLEELAQHSLAMTFEEGFWTVNRDACYTLVADALYDQSYAAPETYTQRWNRTISNNVKSDALHPDPDLDGDGKQLLADQYVGYMTNTQGGIYLGMKQLADTAEMTFTTKLENDETAIVARIPAVMILTDGGANFAFNKPSEDTQHELPLNTGDEWYDIYLPQEDITNLYNGGLPQSRLTSIPTYSDRGIFYDSDMDVGGTPSTILEVLMTASYMKTVVEKHYEQGWEQGKASASSRVPLSVYTVSVDAEHLPAWARYRIYPTMDPEEYFNATRWNDANYASIGADFQEPLPWREEQDIQMEDLLPYTYGKWEEWMGLTAPDESIPDEAAPDEATPGEATLSKATLSEATPGEATLSKATLSEATLSEATPGEATLSKATLSEATPGEATLSKATLSEATPSEVIPSAATLNEVIPSAATLNEAIPSEAIPSEETPTEAVPNGTISLLADWIGNSGSRGFEFVQLDDDPNHAVSSCATLKIGVLPEEHAYTWTDAAGQLLEEISVTNQDVIDHINYPDRFFDVESQDLSNVFREVVDMLVNRIFVPVSGVNGAGAKDSATYRDPVGTYMQLKRDAVVLRAAGENGKDQRFDMAALLFGEMHGLTRAAVVDRRFNEAYAESHGGILEDFQDGWYRGENPETAEFRASDAPEASESDGWVYRAGDQTLIDFVPTLRDAGEPSQDTVYTLYRFADDEEAQNSLRMNPVYGDDVPVGLVNQWNDLDEKPADASLYEDVTGVYRLSDIRVWTERTVAAAGDAPGMETLCVDLPASAMPAQTAVISYDAGGPVVFERNWQDKKQSTPFRLFYAVGVDDALIDRDEDGTRSWVDIESLPQDYVTDHPGEAFGSVYFYAGGVPDTGDALSTGETPERTGGAGVTFAPSEENSYYRYQTAQPLYTRAYRVTDANPQTGSGLDRVEPADGETGTEGAYMGTYRDEAAYAAARKTIESAGGVEQIRDGFGRLYPFQEGGMVLLERDLLTPETLTAAQPEGSAFHPEDVYFVVMESYVPDDGDGQAGHAVQTVACDTGADLIAGAAHEAVADGLCWMDAAGSVDITYDIRTEGDTTFGAPTVEKLTYPAVSLHSYLRRLGVAEDALDAQTAYWLDIQEQLLTLLDANGDGGIDRDEYNAAGFRWAIAARPGGRRSGEVRQSAAAKKQNVTQTAAASFVPAFNTAGETLIVDGALGNNGKLTVSNASLCVTNSIAGTDAPDGTQFAYQLYVERLSGAREAVALAYDPLQNDGNGGWRQQIAALDVKTSESGLLLAADGQPAVVDERGGMRLSDAADGGARYYVYVAPDGMQADWRRIFDGEAKDAEENALPSMGRHVYVTGELPENSTEPNACWTTYAAATSEEPSGTVVLYCKDAWLIPVEEADGGVASWRFDPNDAPGYRHIDGTGGDGAPRALALARMAVSEEPSVLVTSDFLVHVTYQTRTLDFGGGAKTAMTAGDLVDTTPFWVNETACVAIPGQQRAVMETAEYARAEQSPGGAVWLSWDEIAEHTAAFTLGDGEGLMLSVRPGQAYRATQKGLESEGYLLQEAVQEHGADGLRYALNEMQEPSGATVLSAWEDLTDGSADEHSDCGRFPDGPDEVSGGKAVRHWIVYDAFQMDDRSSEAMALLPTARFTRLIDGSHTYSVYGKTDEQSESVRYVNEAQPSALVISNWLEPSGSNVRLTDEDREQTFAYTLSLTDGESRPLTEKLSYVVTGVENGKRIVCESGALTPNSSTPAENDAGLTASEKNEWRFTLQGGQRIAIFGLPQAYACTVTQEAAPFFLTSAAPSGVRDKDQTVTAQATVNANDGTPEIITYTNRKTTHEAVTSEEKHDFKLWGALAAALLFNIAVTAVRLMRKRRSSK